MSYNQIASSAAALALNASNPATSNVERQAHYDVPIGTAPTFVPFSGTTERLSILFSAGGPGIDTSPYKIQISYKRIGNPTGNLSFGIRKANDDFVLLMEHPISEPKNDGIITVTLDNGYHTGFANMYQMQANDKVSVEMTPNDTNTIELACSSTESLPSGFVSQSYDGSYGATTDPLAFKITSRVLVAV